MEETWKVIPRFDKYEVSTEGRVRNKKSKRLLSTTYGNGYVHVTMYQEKYYTRSVHTLVAMTYLSNPEAKPTVNHINKKRDDNRVDNLEWATYSEQIKHRNRERNITFVKIPTYKRWVPSVCDITQEEWRRIPQANGYSISNIGRVRNNTTMKIRTGSCDNRGYCSIKVIGKWFSIHALMALVFFNKKVSHTLVVNHKNGDKSHNSVVNLEVVSQSQNVKHAYKNSFLVKSNKSYVLQVDFEGKVIAEYDSLAQAETKTNINRGCIHHAIENKTPSKGCRWFGTRESYTNTPVNELKKTFKVIQTKDSVIVNSFNSYPEAFSATGISVSNISRSCNSVKSINAGGFKWFKCFYDYEQHVLQVGG